MTSLVDLSAQNDSQSIDNSLIRISRWEYFQCIINFFFRCGVLYYMTLTVELVLIKIGNAKTIRSRVFNKSTEAFTEMTGVIPGSPYRMGKFSDIDDQGAGFLGMTDWHNE